MMGANAVREKLVQEHVKPQIASKILDIGCGPADILGHLPVVDYYGFDISELYIDSAQRKFKNRGMFYCKDLQISDLDSMPEFDNVLCIGFFHHLDDEKVIEVLNLAYRALKKGGRLISLDPVFDDRQSIIARFLIKLDRGDHVRSSSGYEHLAKKVFEFSSVHVRHRAWIPYTHCIIECTK
jgi:SAM-dependent methyltransferase